MIERGSGHIVNMSSDSGRMVSGKHITADSALQSHSQHLINCKNKQILHFGFARWIKKMFVVNDEKIK